MSAIELLRIVAHILIDAKDYDLLLKRRALKECEGLSRIATGCLKRERGVIMLRKGM